jgi:thiol-disulfide isomerase/thioredoxin
MIQGVSRRALGTLGALVFSLAVASAPGAEIAPAFDLPRRGAAERVRLEDFAGQVLVLDFFAYWCAPCERASKELESGVQQFYAARQGNARGAPVRVLSVNIEKDLPERTEEFLRRAGASFVADDVEGALLKQLGGIGIPYLVVIDGTGGSPGQPQFSVVYRHAGFEGVRKLRQVIDGLGQGGATPATQPVPGGARAPGGPVTHTAEVDVEGLWSSDIWIADTRLTYRQERGGTEWNAAFGYTRYEEDYRPFRIVDFFGFDEHIEEDRFSLSGELRQSVSERVTLLGAAGAYDGYADYRRVWIANRYRQLLDHPDFPRIEPYEEPDPKGFNVSAGARWEYLPLAGFAEVRLGYARDQTAPGYTFEIDTNRPPAEQTVVVQGRDRFDTRSLSFSSENVLTRRVRVLNEFFFSEVTDRELRFGYKGSVNVALGERWVLRAYGGMSTEEPQFDAWYVGGSIEFELAPAWLLSVSGRYYEDTGEIENSLPVTSAAPPLTSYEMGVGLRYAGRRWSARLYGGPFWTDYHSRPGIGEEFTFLYVDRNWGLAQLVVSVQF